MTITLEDPDTGTRCCGRAHHFTVRKTAQTSVEQRQNSKTFVLQVTITLEEPDTGTTVLRLRQTGIPREDRFGNGDVKRSTEIGKSPIH